MKKYFALLFLLTSFQLVLPVDTMLSHEINKTVLNERKVQKHKNALEKKVQWRQVERNGVKLAIAAVVVYTAYGVLHYFFGETVAQGGGAVPTPSPDGYLTQFSNWLFNGQTWLGFGQYATQGVIVGAMANRMRNTMEPETICWFANTQAPFTPVLQGIAYNAQQIGLSGEPLNKQQKESIRRQVMLLVHQCEQLIGFMHWKADQFKQEKRTQEAHNIAKELFEQCNAKLIKFNDALENNNALLGFYAESLFGVLQHECGRFALVEGSHWIDPNILLAVAQQMG